MVILCSSLMTWSMSWRHTYTVEEGTLILTPNLFLNNSYSCSHLTELFDQLHYVILKCRVTGWMLSKMQKEVLVVHFVSLLQNLTWRTEGNWKALAQNFNLVPHTKLSTKTNHSLQCSGYSHKKFCSQMLCKCLNEFN